MTAANRDTAWGGSGGGGAATAPPAFALDDIAVNHLFVRSGQPWFDVKAFGALGDNIQDDTAYIQAAYAALPSTGGILYFPPGVYKISSALNFDDKRSVTLQGAGGLDAGAGTSTRISYTGTGTLISARSTYGFSVRDLWLQLTNAAHSGTLIDLAHSGTGGDTSYASFQNCFIGSGTPSVQGTGILVSLDKAINVSFNNINFSGGNIGVQGRLVIGNYSNAIRFFGCNFSYFNTIPVKNAGQVWSLYGCTFEPLYPSGVAGGAGAYTNDAGVNPVGLTFDGCWFGDSNDTGTWITFAGNGLNVRGCLISHANTGINVAVSSYATITGNQLSNLTNGITTGANARLFAFANTFVTVTTGFNVDAATLGFWHDATSVAPTFFSTISVGASQVLRTRRTGWTAPTGTPTRTGYATSTATVTQVAEALKALIDDLISHGLIGA